MGGFLGHADFEEQRQVLSRVAVSWFKPGDFCGRPQPAGILPPLLFASVCEYRQAIADPELGLLGVERALLNLREHAVQRRLTDELAAEIANSRLLGGQSTRKCLLQRALQSIGGAQGVNAGDGSATLAISRNPVSLSNKRTLPSRPSGLARSAALVGEGSVQPTDPIGGNLQHPPKKRVKSRGRSALDQRQVEVSQRECHYKLPLDSDAPLGKKTVVICRYCGCLVRRDVMARHRKTKFCQKKHAAAGGGS